MDRGAWWAAVHGVTVGHNQETFTHSLTILWHNYIFSRLTLFNEPKHCSHAQDLQVSIFLDLNLVLLNQLFLFFLFPEISISNLCFSSWLFQFYIITIPLLHNCSFEFMLPLRRIKFSELSYLKGLAQDEYKMNQNGEGSRYFGVHPVS